jgi:tetratricopeptide (TPR) repeat protein
MSDQARSEVIGLLVQFAADGDPGRLAGPDGRAAESRLLASSGDPRNNSRAAQAIGTLRWCRYLSVLEARMADDGGTDAAEGRDAVAGGEGAGDDCAVAVRLLRWRRRYGPEVPAPLDMLLSDCDKATAAGRVREHLKEHGTAAPLAGAREFIRDVLCRPADPPDQVAELRAAAESLARAGRYEEAVDACERALGLLPEGHQWRALFWLQIGATHKAHAEATGNLDLVTRALSALDTAVSGLPRPHPAYPMALTARALALLFRHEQSEGNDLDECVTGLRAATAATDEDDPRRAERLNLLSVTLRKRACQGLPAGLPDPAGIADALGLGRQAVAAAEDDATRGRILIELSQTLVGAFGATGMTVMAGPSGVDDTECRRLLDEAITRARQGLALLPEDDPFRPLGQAALGTALTSMGAWSTDLAALREGEQWLQRAQAAAADASPEVAGLVSLAFDAALLTRAPAIGELPEADLLARHSQLFPPVIQAWYRWEVASASGDITLQHSMIAELKAAITTADFSRQEPGARADIHLVLATALLSQATSQHADGEAPDAVRALEEAGTAVGRALDMAPPGWHGHTIALGVQELIRDRRALWSGELPPGLSVEEMADELDAASAGKLDALIADQLARIRRASERAREDALDRLLAPEPGWAGTPTGHSAPRARQLLGHARRLMLSGHAAAGHEALTAAIATLENLARKRLAQADLDSLLFISADLAADAVDSACERGDHGAALTLHERVRGLLITRAIETRPDARLLARLPAGDAARFTELSSQVDALDAGTAQGAQGSSSPAGDTDAFAAAAARRRLTGDWEALLTRIRAAPGFERFLLPLDDADIMALAADGPVVTIIPGRNRTHALVATDGSLTEVPLPAAAPETLRHRALSLRTLMQARPARNRAEAEAQLAFRRKRFQGELAWLWEAVTFPVLDSLGLTGPPASGAVLPRLWWSLPSHLSELPLHAAGHHDSRVLGRAAEETVMSRVVSSYVPTLRSLAQSRTQPAGNHRGRLIVSMSSTPGQHPLPGAGPEAAAVQKEYPDAHALADDKAPPEQVTPALRASAWFHFAGHGRADGQHPGASSLILHNGSLTARDVAAMRLRDAQLAFLSACETAVSHAADPHAETLAGAFHLAGFRHVVGTLWRIDDWHAQQIATGFYSRLQAVSGQHAPRLDPGSPHAASPALPVARTLHEVVNSHRRQWPDQPDNWASHIHTGP